MSAANIPEWLLDLAMIHELEIRYRSPGDNYPEL